MRVKLTIIIVLCAVQVGLSQKRLGGNYTFETECMGSELDGSHTLKAWGNGKNQKDAVEQAKKNAVRDVIFKGIHAGKSECSASPILIEINAQKKYEDYFFEFFEDGGKYTEFVTLQDERFKDKVKQRNKKNARNSVTISVVVRVLSNKLKKKLIEDGILN